MKPGGFLGRPKMLGAMTAGGLVSICPLCQGDKTILRPYKGAGYGDLEERNCPVCEGRGTVMVSKADAGKPGSRGTKRARLAFMMATIALSMVMVDHEIFPAWFGLLMVCISAVDVFLNRD